jgi:hypothetical protein
MSRSDVDADFPSLIGLAFELSDEDFNYNCLAYALGDTANWWEPPMAPGQYWPPGFSNDVTVATVEKIIRLHGFTREVEAGVDPETDAIAIFSKGTNWTHFSKYHKGRRASKLGEGHDVSDVHPQHLEGRLYGTGAKILARPKERIQ